MNILINALLFLEFWQYSSTYREQPQIHFLNQWILQVNSDISPVAKTWSTFQGFNAMLQEDTVTPLNSEIAIPVVKVSAINTTCNSWTHTCTHRIVLQFNGILLINHYMIHVYLHNFD